MNSLKRPWFCQWGLFYYSHTLPGACLAVFIFLLSVSFLLVPLAVHAEDIQPLAAPIASGYKSDFYRGKVMAVSNQHTQDSPDGPALSQDIKVKLLTGPEKGKELDIKSYFSSVKGRELRAGELVVINRSQIASSDTYYISDKYRLPPSIVITLLFFVCVIFFAGWKGFSSILGLVLSLLILLKFVVPQILAGHSPLGVSLVGALLIALTSLYLAHGFNKRTSIALLSTLITMVLAVGLSILFVSYSKLTGTGSEESFYLQNLGATKINLQGLLLGGIIIGALGVLDDITTGQVAAVAEIHNANPQLNFQQLYRGGLAVGHEHIASLVNTLVLAYVGASFPLLLLFALNANVQPTWVTVNTEFMTEEIIRTLVGSMALVFAVPIATFLAAYFLKFRGRS